MHALLPEYDEPEVKQTNLDKLHDTFTRVSDPRHADYGRHLSNDEVHALVAPAPASLGAVRAFLAAHGVASDALTPNGDFLRAVVPVSVAEALLSTTYETYAHNGTDYVAHRAASYSLPAEVAAVVDFVSPTIHFPPVAQPVPKFDTLGSSSSSSSSNNNLGVGASKLRELYSVGATVGTGAGSGNRHAVTGFLGQHFHPRDLGEFWKLEMKGVAAAVPTVKEVGDEVEGGLAGTESMLDIEYINAMGANIESEFWGFAGNASQRL